MYIIILSYSIIVGLSYSRGYVTNLGLNMSTLVSVLLGDASITETLVVRLLNNETIFKNVLY